MFRDNAIFIIVISAILVPLIFITQELILVGIFIALFVLAQIIMIYLFSIKKRVGVEEWYAFWSAILSLTFLLVVILIGRKVTSELLGLILFLIYFIGLIILLFRKPLIATYRKSRKKTVTEKDYEDFRIKDELQELVDFFEVGMEPKAEVVDIKEPKIEKIIVEEVKEEKKAKKKKEK
ncbi:hypothetical protein KY341_06485, partial [Candidatus Woesearchaeota archaeon]|nr:hypothetical protein [Candidatus Woesearchaeota archaeon]